GDGPGGADQRRAEVMVGAAHLEAGGEDLLRGIGAMDARVLRGEALVEAGEAGEALVDDLLELRLVGAVEVVEGGVGVQAEVPPGPLADRGAAGHPLGGGGQQGAEAGREAAAVLSGRVGELVAEGLALGEGPGGVEGVRVGEPRYGLEEG